MKHTPTPWTIVDWNEEYDLCTVVQKEKDEEGLLRKVAMYASKEDAEHIVKCVNCHDMLVKALELFKIHMTFAAEIIDRECFKSRLIYQKEQDKFMEEIKSVLEQK